MFKKKPKEEDFKQSDEDWAAGWATAMQKHGWQLISGTGRPSIALRSPVSTTIVLVAKYECRGWIQYNKPIELTWSTSSEGAELLRGLIVDGYAQLLNDNGWQLVSCIPGWGSCHNRQQDLISHIEWPPSLTQGVAVALEVPGRPLRYYLWDDLSALFQKAKSTEKVAAKQTEDY